MNHSPGKTCYADQALQCHVAIATNQRLAPDLFRLRFSAPGIAARSVPGQFVMVRLAGIQDPLIGRPLAVYDIIDSPAGQPDVLEVLYHVKGKFTTRLAQMTAGQMLDVWGPLGNGFPPTTDGHLIMVAGGIGQTPFLTLAKETLGLKTYGTGRQAVHARHVTLLYGAQTASGLIAVDDFQRIGVDIRLATDDGSRGHHGLVTDLLEPWLTQIEPPVQVLSCGPKQMMQRVAEITDRQSIQCLVSLETPMACGIGICFSCVAKIREANATWDYKRTCVEGPVFDAQSIVWD